MRDDDGLPTGSHASIVLGMAGQLRVASELMLRNHIPATPLVDTGVDLILETGIRIQVKSARLHSSQKAGRRNRYGFAFQHWRKGQAYDLSGVDFVVCWGANTDEFWIMPADSLNGTTHLIITPGASGSYTKRRKIDVSLYEGAWHLIPYDRR